jgi:hypothetical protein
MNKQTTDKGKAMATDAIITWRFFSRFKIGRKD